MDDQRFWSKVNKRTGGECWEWTAARNLSGYGSFRLNGVPMNASRAAWIITHGDPGPSSLVCHRCDNPACCNPSHLFLGTYKDNRDDSLRKGRRMEIAGTHNPQAKFSDKTVARVRTLRAQGLTHARVAQVTGVSRPHVSHILGGNRRAVG